MSKGSFKTMSSFESRLEVSKKIRSEYPDRIPVIVERDPKSHLADIQKKKFLAPSDLGVAKFISEIRNHIKLHRNEALFVFVGDNVMPQPNFTMSQIYEKHKDEDGFLYIVYSSENTFG